MMASLGGPPPKRLNRDLPLRALAYHVQERTEGGLRPVTRRQLARAAEDISPAARPRQPRRQSSLARGCCVSGKA
jgi:hypothetical protein